MKWEEVRAAFPDRWVVFEALDSRVENGQMIVEDVAVVNQFGTDGFAAQKQANVLLKRHFNRRYFFYHTARERIEIEVRDQFGLPLVEREPAP
jgi:hypothetical protein